VDSPEHYEVLPAEFVEDVLITATCLVLVESASLVAYGRSGLAWRFERPSWDQLDRLHVSGQYIVGYGWNYQSGRWECFRVATSDGRLELQPTRIP
jgi:hypothetical protein